MAGNGPASAAAGADAPLLEMAFDSGTLYILRTEVLALAGQAGLADHRAGDVVLAVHELAANAAKYGSLSVNQGAVQIEWEADERNMRLQWRETGGPTTKPPERQGNGAKIVNGTVQQLGGTIDYDWRPEGLTVRLRLPIASLDK